MSEGRNPQRRVLVAADMESYSKRNNPLQHRAQKAFRRIMKQAAAEVGLDRVGWQIQQGGDGELAILPAGTSERRVAGFLAPVADRLLREYNQPLAPAARIRLRIAVHQGLVHLDGANGFPGEAVVHVCRLVDSPQVKQALHRFEGADVVLVVSDSLYREVIEHYRDLRPEHFAEVRAVIPDKQFSAAAWIYVPGENAAAEPATQDRDAPAPPAPAPGGQSFSGITTNAPAQFGNDNVFWHRHD